MDYPEVVRVCVSIGNGTLRHAVDFVSFICVKLANPVPMDCTSTSRDIVGDMIGEIIARADSNQRFRISIVEDFAFGFEICISRDSLVGQVEPIFTMNALLPRVFIIGVDNEVTSLNKEVLHLVRSTCSYWLKIGW